MRVLIVGSLAGELGRAAQLAASRGARVSQAAGVAQGQAVGGGREVRQEDIRRAAHESAAERVHRLRPAV